MAPLYSTLLPQLLLFLWHFSCVPIMSLQNQTLDAVFPAVYVIGDSTADAGVNNRIRTIVRSNFPPYGRDFDGHLPTGRFSNGKLITDFIASALGIKEVLPAYLDPNLSAQDLLTGVSFASAGSGFDNLTAKIQSVVPVWKQLEWLGECTKKLKEEVGEEKGNKIISESLYAVTMGSNDLLITYFSTPFRKRKYDLPAYVSFLAQATSNVVKEMYRLGARKMAVLGLGPLGCVPFQRSVRGGVLRECSELLNAAAMDYNIQLSAHIKLLAGELNGSNIIYIDIYNIFLDIILNYKNYGFEEQRLGCCGTGTLEVSILCNKRTPFTCSDASKYVFWDSVHPTEKAYKIIADRLYQNYIPLFL